MTCEGADVDDGTQNTDELLCFSEGKKARKKSPKSSKNKFKATFYLRHSDTAKAHHKDK